jgi:hypothetical protein
LKEIKMDELELYTWIKKIKHMTHEELAYLYRFSKPGCIVFTDPTLYALFKERFEACGGWTPEVSKKIGLEP